jgi:hypothetical protein
MSLMTLDLAPAADQVSKIIAGITDDQLTAATPCEGMDVATMLAHVQGLSVAFRDAARKVAGPTTSTAPQAAPKDLSPGWREEIPVAGQPYAAAPENLEASWQMVSNTPDEPEARAGLFGPRIPIADDAPLLDRTLAYAGRDPQWVPWS